MNKEYVLEKLESLPERARLVVTFYHYERLSFKEIALVFRFNTTRAEQLYNKGLDILRRKHNDVYLHLTQKPAQNVIPFSGYRKPQLSIVK